jgi:hypothetical protein
LAQISSDTFTAASIFCCVDLLLRRSPAASISCCVDLSIRQFAHPTSGDRLPAEKSAV